MRGAPGSLRHRQEHRAPLHLRQLPGRRRAHPRPAPGRNRGHGGGASPQDTRCPQSNHRLCQPVPARHPARGRGGRGRRAASQSRRRPARGEASRARNTPEPQHSGRTAPAGPGDLLRRRTAAGQPRARLRCQLSRAAADEPTASLDRENRDAAIGLIREAVRRGAAIVGIFHDSEVRDAVATRTVPLSAAREAA